MDFVEKIGDKIVLFPGSVGFILAEPFLSEGSL
jgi:hypothetical protein